MNTIKQLLFSLLGVIQIMLIAVCVSGVEISGELLPFLSPEMFTFLFGTGTFSLAMATVGTIGERIDTSSTTGDRLLRDVSKDITVHRPDAFRLDTALRKLKSKPLSAPFAEWEEVGQFPRIATVSDAADIASAAEVEIPLSTTGASKYYNTDDILRVFDVAANTDHANFTEVRLYVKERNDTTNTITVRAFNATGFVPVPAIPADTLGTELQVIRLGNGKSESDGVGKARMMEPVQIKNGIHTFETFINISKLRKKFKTYTEDDMKRNIRQSIYDFRLSMEGTLWDGVGMHDVHPDNSEKMYTMKGFSSFIKSNIIALPAVGDITETMFLDWAEQVSDDSHGSEEKMFWVSAGLWTEINKIPLIKETLQSRRSERVLGAYVNRIQAGHCDLLIGVHKGFKELGKRRFGAIIDPIHICKRVVEPMQTTDIDPEKVGGKREQGRKYLETFTVEMRYEKTHALLY